MQNMITYFYADVPQVLEKYGIDVVARFAQKLIINILMKWNNSL